MNLNNQDRQQLPARLSSVSRVSLANWHPTPRHCYRKRHMRLTYQTHTPPPIDAVGPVCCGGPMLDLVGANVSTINNRTTRHKNPKLRWHSLLTSKGKIQKDGVSHAIDTSGTHTKETHCWLLCCAQHGSFVTRVLHLF